MTIQRNGKLVWFCSLHGSIVRSSRLTRCMKRQCHYLIEVPSDCVPKRNKNWKPKGPVATQETEF